MKILHKVCISLCILISLTINSSESTPLDDYVHAEDPHFGWTLINTYDEIDYKLYVLNFTSQKWLDGNINSKFFLLNTTHFFQRKLFISINLVALFMHNSTEEINSTRYWIFVH